MGTVWRVESEPMAPTLCMKGDRLERLLEVLSRWIAISDLRTIIVSFLLGIRIWVYDAATHVNTLTDWACGDDATTAQVVLSRVTSGCALDARHSAITFLLEDGVRSLAWRGQRLAPPRVMNQRCSVHDNGRYLFVQSFLGGMYIETITLSVYECLDSTSGLPSNSSTVLPHKLVGQRDVDVSQSSSATHSGRFVDGCGGLQPYYAVWKSLYHGTILRWPTLEVVMEFSTTSFAGHPGGGHNTYMHDCGWIGRFLITSHAYGEVVAYDFATRKARHLLPQRASPGFFIILTLSHRTILLPSQWLIPHDNPTNPPQLLQDNVYYQIDNATKTVQMGGRILTGGVAVQLAYCHAEYTIVDDRWFVGTTAHNIQRFYNYPPLDRCCITIDLNEAPADLKPQIFPALLLKDTAHILAANLSHD